MKVTQARLHRAIRLQRDRVLQHDGLVDDCRLRLDSAVVDLQTAVRERQRAAQHLHHLIEWHASVHRTTITSAPTVSISTATYYLRTA